MIECQTGRPEAAEAIWSWEETPETARGPLAGSLRLRGLIQGAVGLAIGSAVYLLWSQTVGQVIGVLATLILLAGLLSPTGVYAMLHRLFVWTGYQVGRVLTWVLLVPLFYTFFYPFGLLFRRARRDRMRRFFEDVDSYWEDHDSAIAKAGPQQRPY